MHGKLMAHRALVEAHQMSSQKSMTMACEGCCGRAIPRSECGYYTKPIYFDKVILFSEKLAALFIFAMRRTTSLALSISDLTGFFLTRVHHNPRADSDSRRARYPENLSGLEGNALES